MRAHTPGVATSGGPKTQDADKISDCRLLGPAITYRICVRSLMGRLWSEENRQGLAKVGMTVRDSAKLFESGLFGPQHAIDMELDLTNPRPAVEKELRAWLRACARRYRHKRQPSFDVYYLGEDWELGGLDFVVTFAPPPPAHWRKGFTRRFGTCTTSDAPVVHVESRPVFRVSRGQLAFWWDPSPAFLRRAARLYYRVVRAIWKTEGHKGPIPETSYMVPTS